MQAVDKLHDDVLEIMNQDPVVLSQQYPVDQLTRLMNQLEASKARWPISNDEGRIQVCASVLRQLTNMQH